LRVALTASGYVEQSAQPVHEAEVLARALGDPRRLTLALSTLANHYWASAEYHRARDYAQSALETAETQDEEGFRVTALVMLGRAHHALGQYERAEEYLRASLAAVQDAPLREHPGQPSLASIVARVWLAFCAAERGDFRTAHLLGEEGLRVARAVDRPWNLINAYWGAGHPCLLQGQVEQAIAALEPAVQACETWRIPLLFPISAANLGQAYLLAGRTRDAQSLLERAIQQMGVLGNAMHRVGATLALGEAYLKVGDQGRAHALATEGLALSQAQGARSGEASAWRLLGAVAAGSDPPDREQAENHYRQALALADELGMRPLMAHGHLDLGTLYQKVGRDDEAQAELRTATEMYRAMEMAFWLEKAETLLTQVAP